MTNAEYITIANAETAAAVALREAAHTHGENSSQFLAAYRALVAARGARMEAQEAMGVQVVRRIAHSLP